MKKNNSQIIMPNTFELEEELNRVIFKNKYKKILKSTIYTLIIVISFAILLSTLFFPVLEIYGSSMTPNFKEGDIVVCANIESLNKGDVIAFYYNNKILIKRIIASSSDWVNIDKEGNVFINNKLLEESYINKKSYGEVNIQFPYQVPEGTYFVLGDKREYSIDSRNSLLGTVSQEDIIGKVIFRVWPIKKIGLIK